ncbi:MAG: beta-lactamase family protein [Gemmatimonadaceae bacterium]|nr:beta-lactamase family protein [Acetobacteraceae bacterium]
MNAHEFGPAPARRAAFALVGAALAAWPAFAQPQPSAGATVTALPTAQPLPVAKPEDVGLDPTRLARIRPAFEREVTEGRIPGAVLMVARRGKLAYTETIGFRDQKEAVAMTPDTVFRLYSMTKPMTSVAVMMLVEEGRIGLADPVSRYLPAFGKAPVSVVRADATEQVAAERPIRIYDLLRHTSGLAYGELTANAPVRDAYVRGGLRSDTLDYESRSLSPEAFTQAVAAAPLARQPGTTWEYGVSVDVLGRVVEAVSGQRLEAFLDDRLFKPLRMADTGFSLRDAAQGRRLALHSGVDPAAGNKPVGMIDVSSPPGNASGGAGAIGTAGDYLRFGQMLVNGGVLDGARILSPATIRLMTTDHVAGLAAPLPPGMLLLGSPGYGFGLGFLVRLDDGGALVSGREGQFMWAGYGGTYFWVDPKAELVAVLLTAAPSAGRAAHRRLFQTLVYSAIVD